MKDFLYSILRGLVDYQIGVFFFLVLGLFIYFRRLLRGLQEWKKSVFGLERSIAQRKLVSTATGLTLLVLLFIGEFLLATIIGPRMPVASIEEIPSAETLTIGTATIEAEGGATPAPVATIDQEALVSQCVEGVTEITSPANGATVSGTVELIGSVNVVNFGSYKYEFSPTGSINWTTIAANNTLKLDESLGYWYTSNLAPGTYLLQLVPLDNTGREMTPCIITVEVVPDHEE